MKNQAFQRELARARYAKENGLSLREVGVERRYTFAYLCRELDDKFSVYAEQRAIKELIGAERGLDPERVVLCNLSARHDYGRVYFGAIEGSSGRALIFTIYEGARTAEVRPQHQSDWEVEDLLKFARGMGFKPKAVEVLEPMYLFCGEVRQLAVKLNEGSYEVPEHQRCRLEDM